MVAVHETKDDELFRGGVPQPADWIRPWQACRCPVSYHSAQCQGVVENFIHGSRGRLHVTRRGFAAMVSVMSLVLRDRIRQHLLRAHSITLSLDDRGPFRLIRSVTHHDPRTITTRIGVAQ